MSANLAEPLGAARPFSWFGGAGRGRAALAPRAEVGVRWFMLVLVALYLAKQILFVVAFPPFSGHDEVAHFSYLDIVATERRLPVLPDLAAWRRETARNGDTSFDGLMTELYPYCRYTLYWFCQPNDPQWAKSPPRTVFWPPTREYFPTGELYTANHPPLYYLLMSPFYLVARGWGFEATQYLLRFLAIPFGLATVLLAFLLTRTLFPTDRFLAVSVPTFVALQPQISYEAAMVNNDILAIAGYSLMLWLIVRGVRDGFPGKLCVALGVALGLAVVAKSTSLTAAPIIGAAVIATVGWRDVRGWLGRGLAILAPAVVLASPWYAFLYRTYGNFDALPQISAVQSYWNSPEGTFWELLTSPGFVAMRFRETWGEFGWRVLPLDRVLLWAIAVPLLVAAAGLVGYLWLAVRARRGEGPGDDDPVLRLERWQWIGLGVLAAACLIAYLAVVQFGTDFALTQARYYFPVVNAAALLLMLGLRTLIPRRHRHYGQGAVFAALVLLNVLLFTQYVVPYYLAA
jgi:4-amino-4-deoxy-L-arabinose transferase-like glycosyltransferase